MKIALCCIAKLENNYLREWVDYHLNIGFDHVYIYDNNNTKDERCEDVVIDLIEQGLVSIVNYRGKKQTACQIQVEAYKNCYDTYNKLYDWIMFIDVDEFLVLKRHKNIQEYLGESVFKNANVIKINWLCYGDNEKLYYEQGLVRERFTKPCKNEENNKFYKSFVRCGIPNLGFPNVHYTSKVENVVMNNGKEVKWSFNVKLKECNHDWAYIAHYVTKSLEEYVNVKRKRRAEGSSKTRLSKDFYWRYNEKTEEKVKLMNKLFH